MLVNDGVVEVALTLRITVQPEAPEAPITLAPWSGCGPPPGSAAFIALPALLFVRRRPTPQARRSR